MENAITAFYGSATSLDALDEMVKQSAPNVPQPTNGMKFIRLSADNGEWVYGADNTEVEEGSLWAVNPFSFRTGWVCWADPKKNGGKREKLGEVMASINTPPPLPEADHSAKGGEWQEQLGFDLICINGEDEGTECQYNVNSYGGKAAFGDLFAEVGLRPVREYCFPVIKLGSDSYFNKTYARNVYTPIFDVMDWADMEQNLLSDGAVEKLEAPEAAEVDSSEAAPEADDATAETEAPKRRQRRRVNA